MEQTDPSVIDNVKQLINKDNKTRLFKVIISKLAGSSDEAYALVSSSPMALRQGLGDF